MLTPEQFDAWINALVSGKYKQGRGVLRRRNGETCALGVLADTLGAEYLDVSQEMDLNTYVFVKFPDGKETFVGMLPENILPYTYQDKISRWNDHIHSSFEEIALKVEAYRKQLCLPPNKSTTG